MKLHNKIRRRKIDVLAKGSLFVFLSLAPVADLYSQSAAAIVAETGVSSLDAQEASEVKVDLKPVDNVPSRFAGEDIGVYTASRAAVFSMKNRVTDPFGLNQDPSVKPVIKSPATMTPSKRLAALPPTPLADVVKLIPVTTIMPGEKKFLVGVRSFSESEEFSLIFQNKRMKLEIVEVSSRSILFRNIANGDTASLQTKILPPGMLAGGGKIRPPGMVSPLDDVPLEVGTTPEPEPEPLEESP